MSSLSGLARLGARATAVAVNRANAARPFSVSAVAASDRIPVTMIPGDGVGPELMDAVKELLTNIGAPIDFETFHLSEVWVHGNM